MDKLKMQTPNIANENYKKLAEMFPNAVTESIDENGEIVRAIDKDVLMQEISCKVVEGREERYQFTWPDKKQAILTANAPINKALRPCREESVDFDKTENLYIEGDNLEVLKLLQETYLGKIKMIYIDPPYNTGNDFVYNDDFAQSTDYYLKNSRQIDDDGNRLVPNLESNGRFHTDWLNMIYPRLKIAKDLLSDDGAIFISIDDNEVDNLKKICNEILGESNFVAIINWKRSGGRQDSKYYAVIHEYILCYSKSIANFEAGEEIKYGDIYPKFDKERQSYYKTQLLRKWGSNSLREDRPNLYYPIKGPNGEDVYPIIYKEVDNNDQGFIKIQGRWRWGVSNLDEAQADGRIEFQKNKYGEWVAYEKIFAPKVGEENTKKYTTWVDNVSNGTDSVKKLFSAAIFDYSKSAELITRFLKMANLTKNDICLDFFSGSATTADAVMQLNAEDKGRRKFIMVQIPELCDEKSEAYKAGYKNICEIGKERIRRAGKKIKEEKGLTAQDLDTGFRVLKCDSSNLKDIYYYPEKYTQKQIKGFYDNIEKGRTSEDLLFQVMLDLGVLLSSKIEEKQICGKRVFTVAPDLDKFLVACFDDNITDEVVKIIAEMHPYYAVFCDKGMKTDSTIANFDQIFDAISPTTVRKVL